MPHLQFDINVKAKDDDKVFFSEKIKALFSEIMGTGTEHISISIREHDTFNLFIGRVKDNKEGVALVNADIREGREIILRRKLALGFMGILADVWDIPHQNIYVTFTEHKGEDFHLHERYLSSWQDGEDPLNDPQ
ncbi:MAG: tautomerase [Denitrovibrio sp.]|nr:MAG: tautomerase [Denitrovibrio sp.]